MYWIVGGITIGNEHVDEGYERWVGASGKTACCMGNVLARWGLGEKLRGTEMMGSGLEVASTSATMRGDRDW